MKKKTLETPTQSCVSGINQKYLFTFLNLFKTKGRRVCRDIFDKFIIH